jgi:hypothetical protein
MFSFAIDSSPLAHAASQVPIQYGTRSDRAQPPSLTPALALPRVHATLAAPHAQTAAHPRACYFCSLFNS